MQTFFHYASVLSTIGIALIISSKLGLLMNRGNASRTRIYGKLLSLGITFIGLWLVIVGIASMLQHPGAAGFLTVIGALVFYVGVASLQKDLSQNVKSG